MTNFGALTPNAVGTILKEMVRRAIEVIQERQLAFEILQKTNPLSGKGDIVTSVDLEVQELYLHLITSCLPEMGIIAEEDSLRIKEDNRFCITVDPLDGTRAFVRGQSHGVGTMIALLDGDNICSAYIGDVNTKEIFGYRPNGTHVHHITRYNVGRVIEVDHQRHLTDQHLLTRFNPTVFSDDTKKLFLSDNRLFNGYEIGSGSIGLEFARLWKREVGGILIRPTTITPWDLNPIIGISQLLGYRFYALRGSNIEPLVLNGIRDYTKIDDEVLICHESRADELRNFFGISI